MLQIGRSLLLVIITCFSVVMAFAQDCSNKLTGLVEDDDGEALVGATIWLETLQKGTSTDVSGRFFLEGLCPGQYELHIRYVGFADETVLVRVPGTRSIVVRLKPSAQVLHDVVVEGNHGQRHSLSQSLSILTEEQMSASRGKPLGEMVQQIPGVQSIMTGSGIFKPVIHGLYGQRIAILNNGLRQEGQQWGIEHAPEIDTYTASEVEVVKGSEAVRFGADAMGGVIILNAPPLHYLTSLGGELNTAISSNNRSGTLSGMLEGGFTKKTSWGWRLQGTIKRGGDYHTPYYNLSNTGTREYNMAGTLGFKRGNAEVELYASSFNTRIGILRSAHTGNLDDLQRSIVSEKPWYIEPFTYDIKNPFQQIGHHLVKLSGRIKTGSNSSILTQYGFQFNRREEYDVRRRNNNVPSLSLDLFSHTVDAIYEHDKQGWSGSAGISMTLKDNFNARGTGLLPDYKQFTAGVFVLEKYSHKKWLFEAGLRVDRQQSEAWLYRQSVINPELTFNYLAASIGAAVHLGQSARFSTNASIAHRPPHISELYSSGLHHSTASIENGLMLSDTEVSVDESNVKSERSHQWVNTFQYTRKKVSLELSAYVNYFKDYVYITPSGTALTIRGFFPVFQYRQTDAVLAGADFSLGLELTRHLSYAGKAAYVYTEDLDANNKLPFVPPVQFENSITYRKPAIGKWKSFFVTLSVQSLLKQTRAPQTVYPADVAAYTGETTFDFMPAPDGYTLLRMESGIKLPLDNRDVTVSFSADNLLNTAYRNYMNRLRYYADEAGRNFSLRINYTFHSH
jgi:iron complex outermembrane recepter protein